MPRPPLSPRPACEPLEDRTTPAVTIDLSGGGVRFLGDAANDTLAVSVTTAGLLRHNLPGYAGDTDLDAATAGIQSRLVSSLAHLEVNLGGGTDTVSLTGVDRNAAVTAEQPTFNLSGGADATLTNASLAVTGGPSPFTYALSGLTKATVNGGTGENTIDASAFTLGPVTLTGGDGNDTLTGSPAADTLDGGAGDDALFSRDNAADTLTGGTGHDSASFESFDTPTGVEVWNPIPQAATNRSQKVKVLVVNYDPLVPSQGNKHLYDLFGWNSPHDLAAGYEEALERASGGAVTFDVVEWRNVNEIPKFYDGTQYTPDQYYQNRLTNTGWNFDSSADVPKIFRDQNIAPLIDSGAVDEVWFFGDHFFAIGGESFMAGPGAFFINGPVFSDVPTVRPFVSYGFSYERGVAEMLHNTGHRVENHGNRTWGDWNLANPTTNWDKFSANVTESNGVAGVGTCHFPPNGAGHYDYGNTTTVQTWADDFLDYPEFTGATRPANRDTWRRNSGTTDDHRAYLEWYFHHIPRGAGTNADGRANNWYKYIYDYANYTPSGQPLAPRVGAFANDLYALGGADHTFQVWYSSPNHVRVDTIGTGDVQVTGPNGFNQTAQLVSVSDAEDGPYRVATYRVTAPGGSWDAAERGVYTVTLQSGQVSDHAGAAFAAGAVGQFTLRGAAGTPLPNDADTSLLLRFDDNLNGVGGETPASNIGVSYITGTAGSAARMATPGFVRYATAGNVSPTSGTVEFWLRPEWNTTDPGNPVWFSVGTPFNRSVQFQFDDWGDDVKMMMWGDDPDTPAVETNWERNFYSHVSWSAGEWHHLAATWDVPTRTMSMYVDGVQVQTRTDAPILTAFSTTFLSIGVTVQGESQPAAQAFDEFRISSRARSAGEIAAAYRAGISATALSLDAASFPLARFDSRRLTATATAAFGGSQNVSGSVVWTSSDPAVATVSADGTVRAVGAGTAVITATLDTLTATCSVTVTDPNRPTAALSPIADVTAGGGTSLTFTVTYADDAAVRAATVTGRNVRVFSANGYSRHATLMSVTPGGDGTPRTATYRITPAGGAWDVRDNGLYTVELGGWQVGDAAGQWAPAATLGTFQVNILPAVAGVLVNGTATPATNYTASRVTSLVVTFNMPVTAIDPGAFTLTRGATTLTSGGAVTVSGLGTSTLTLTFTGTVGVESGSLADGVWALSTDLSKVRAGAAVGAGTTATGNIRRLFGDANGDGLVNLVDFGLFGSAFGKGSAAAGFNGAFDFNGDNVIDLADFGAFGQRFGKGL